MVWCIISAMWLIIGFGFCIQVKKAEKNKLKLAVFGSVLILLGIIGIMGVVLQNNRWITTGALIPIAVFTIEMPWSVIKKARNCKTQIQATCTKKIRYASVKGQENYAPVFAYLYEGNEYEVQSPLTYTKSEITKKYTIGEQYPVYVDSNHPEYCIESNKVPFWYYVTCFIGWGMLVFFMWNLIWG